MNSRRPDRENGQLGLFAAPPRDEPSEPIERRKAVRAARRPEGSAPTLDIRWGCRQCGSGEVADPSDICDACSEVARIAEAAARDAELKEWRLLQLLRIELGEDAHHSLVAENFIDPLDREVAVSGRAEAATDVQEHAMYVASTFRAQSKRSAAYADAWRRSKEWRQAPPFCVPDELPLRRPVEYLFFNADWETDWEEELADGLPIGESVWYPDRPVRDVEVGLWL